MKSTDKTEIQQTFLHLLSKQVDLSEKEQEVLLNLPIFKSFSKGTQLFNKGDVTNSYYLVLQGGIRTYSIVDGEDITTGLYIETEALLPASTVMKIPSQYYATCFEDSLVIVFTEEFEQHVFQEIPEFVSVCRKFSETLLVEKQESLDMYRTLSPEQRYVHLTKVKPELVQRVPQYHLASFLGIRPESLSRIRKRLTRKSYTS